MGAKYRVKIFESMSPSSPSLIESQMNHWLEGIGTKIDIIEFFPVSVSTSIGVGMVAKPQIPSPLKVEMTTPTSSGYSASQTCSSCYSSLDKLSVDENTKREEETIAAVGVLYIEYPDPPTEQAEQSK
jgi:hypothetical protein